MDTISVEAYAKINIGLDVLEKRADGYHDVRMIMQTIDISDTIVLEKRDDSEIVIESDSSLIPLGRENLAYRAVEEFKNEFNSEFSDEFEKWDFGVNIKIKKRIPVQAGLGGGSSDAAAVLKGMNILFDVGLSRDKLMSIGARVGSDVPYCIFGHTAYAGGRGEKIIPVLGFPKTHIVIAKPLDIGISTEWAYTSIDSEKEIEHPDIDGLLEQLKEAAPLSEIVSFMGNSFEGFIIRKYPVIGELKESMEENGAVKAMMSGSGPSVYGLFKTQQEAEDCKNALALKYKDSIEVFTAKTR